MGFARCKSLCLSEVYGSRRSDSPLQLRPVGLNPMSLVLSCPARRLDEHHRIVMDWVRLQFWSKLWKDKVSASLRQIGENGFRKTPGINLVDSHSSSRKPSWLQGRLADAF